MTCVTFHPRPMARRATPMTTNNETRAAASATWQPRVDVSETEQAVLIAVELPGVPADKVTVSIEENLLKVSGEKNSVTESTPTVRLHRNERAFGKFERAFRLSDTIDVNGITASNRDGVLTLTLPKQTKAQPREIAIVAG